MNDVEKSRVSVFDLRRASCSHSCARVAGVARQGAKYFLVGLIGLEPFCVFGEEESPSYAKLGTLAYVMNYYSSRLGFRL